MTIILKEKGEGDEVSIHYEETPLGFIFGPAEVERYGSDNDKGWVIIGLTTPKLERVMQIYVTKTGKVRVWGDDGREWKPE